MTPNPQMPQQPMPQQKGWFGRNWFWVVPVGCLVPMLCCGVFAGVTYFGATKAMKSSAVYAEGVARALSSPEVRAALGEPVTPGFAMQGSVSDKEADIQVPLEGKKAKGTLYVVGKKVAGKWQYERMEVDVGGKRIDLLGGGLGGLEGKDVEKELQDLEKVFKDIAPDEVQPPDDKAPLDEPNVVPGEGDKAPLKDEGDQGGAN
ncbi:MAG: hypothetical protein JNJ54_25825 [Myxococcaceae bacterium]|nr:hypothetical protein [Myxococcaceae bacterium]